MQSEIFLLIKYHTFYRCISTLAKSNIWPRFDVFWCFDTPTVCESWLTYILTRVVFKGLIYWFLNFYFTLCVRKGWLLSSYPRRVLQSHHGPLVIVCQQVGNNPISHHIYFVKGFKLTSMVDNNKLKVVILILR